jgi:hypothetical protein
MWVREARGNYLFYLFLFLIFLKMSKLVKGRLDISMHETDTT